MRLDRAAYACLWLLLPGVPFLAAAAGDAACVTCHAAQTAHFRATPMAQALESVEACNILKQHPDLSFQEGPYQSRIARQGDHHVLLVDADSKRDSFCYALGLAEMRGLLDLVANPKLDPSPLIVKTPSGKWHNGFDNDAGRNALTFYIEAVQKYNTDLSLFPANVVAAMSGFQREDAYFKTEPDARTAPKVQF